MRKLAQLIIERLQNEQRKVSQIDTISTNKNLICMKSYKFKDRSVIIQAKANDAAMVHIKD